MKRVRTPRHGFMIANAVAGLIESHFPLHGTSSSPIDLPGEYEHEVACANKKINTFKGKKTPTSFRSDFCFSMNTNCISFVRLD